jgi:hypothetical protein
LTEVISAPQMKDLLPDFGWYSYLGVLRARFAVDERGLALLLVVALPLVECLSRDTKMAAGLRNVAGFFGMVENTELPSAVS